MIFIPKLFLMDKKIVDYECNGTKHKGYLAYNKSATPRPAVIVAHAFRGLDDFARSKAEALAELGYVGFAADNYGNGTTVDSNEKAADLMKPLFINRKLLRERIVAAYRTIAKQPGVDKTRIGAIGFCFGGLTVLELSRSGENLKGIVSFHGVLGNTMSGNKAQTLAPAQTRHGAVLILHGHQDPLVSQNDISDMQKELSNAKLDWQMHIYGNAVHAFTNPQAHDAKDGLLYNAEADRRSWLSMRNFFEEVFK